MSGSLPGNNSDRYGMRSALAILLSLVLASCADHLLARWLGGFGGVEGVGIYRRVGPENGAQILATGSSLTVSGLYWSKVSEALGEGIETWGVGGSSPDIWEEWQRQRPSSNATIIGVSVYDLNEMHLANDRATIVPLGRTIKDLWSSGADGVLWHRIVSQYTLNYIRFLFPTAGNSDRVLVNARAKIAERLGMQSRLSEHEGVVVEPRPPLLDAGESTSAVSEWTDARVLRRMAVLRAENRGLHEFSKGPKHIALRRLLSQSQRQGRVMVVVLPVSQEYSDTFVDAKTATAFEAALQETLATVPEATVVRLDRVPGISDPRNFFDLVHMNSLGRRLATQSFLAQVTHGAPPILNAASAASTSSSKKPAYESH